MASKHAPNFRAKNKLIQRLPYNSKISIHLNLQLVRENIITFFKWPPYFSSLFLHGVHCTIQSGDKQKRFWDTQGSRL